MKIASRRISGEVYIPSSKSFLHREIILAALSKNSTKIFCTEFGKDIFHTIDCINALGGNVTVCKDYILVEPIKNVKNNVVLNVGESGSTLRFLIPVVASFGIHATFIGEESIINRPIKPILDLLIDNGIKVSSSKLPLEIEGKLKAGSYKIDGSISSQFATGLLIALANLEGSSSLEILNAKSNDYINITISVLRDFNVKVKHTDKYYIEGNSIASKGEIVTEGDWSSAAFIMGLGVLSGEVKVKNLNINSSQGDKIIVDVLKKMGANISVTKDYIIAKKSDLVGTEFSINDYPDMAPILSILMASAKGVSIIKNVTRLKYKESDRLSNIIKMLNNLNIECKEENDSLIITGGKFNSCVLNGENDHRIALSSIVALTTVGGTVLDTECMDKSYPTFLDDYKKLGGYYE